MPIYEFKCEDCGKEFEKFVVLPSQVKDVRCPECGSENVKKKISACGVKSSGSDFSSGSCSSGFG